jgi:hypothetical protein
MLLDDLNVWPRLLAVAERAELHTRGEARRRVAFSFA